MPLTVNLRHLENRDVILRGELSLTELDFDLRDEMIRVTKPLRYVLQIEMLGDSLLVKGSLQLALECQCVRCLKCLDFELELDPWVLHLPLEGEDAVIIKSDYADLTPLVREDILLQFPQHPLCKANCGGFKKAMADKASKTVGRDNSKPSVWVELNKLNCIF